MGLGQFNSLGEYCDPHTAYSVFLILILRIILDVQKHGFQWSLLLLFGKTLIVNLVQEKFSAIALDKTLHLFSFFRDTTIIQR